MQYKKLTDDELSIYSRQIVLGDIGYDGQLQLKNAKVCLVGVGGLGTSTAFKLTGMGVGKLRIVDRDIVSRSDLHRQYLYDAKSIGRPKVEVAAEKLNHLNPDIIVEAVPESLNSLNVSDIVRDIDVVVDGLDRPQPRYLINRACNKRSIPYIFGAAIETYGQVTTLLPGHTFCLECFMPGLQNDTLPSCGTVGVHPSVLGIVSSIQVAEAVRFLTGKNPLLLNKLLNIDIRDYTFEQVSLSADPACKVCGENSISSTEELTDQFFEESCARDGRRNFVVSPKTRINIDPAQLASVIEANHYTLKSIGRMGVTFDALEIFTVCLLISGIMIAQTPPRTDENYKPRILSIYKQLLVDGLGYPPEILPF